ncbi:hypothetical protein EDB19DRAFT_1827407 [Suillus lakei]|nr:hypothetical protein EDB19DRAFT_1827407 [Suillus lakei]
MQDDIGWLGLYEVRWHGDATKNAWKMEMCRQQISGAKARVRHGCTRVAPVPNPRNRNRRRRSFATACICCDSGAEDAPEDASVSGMLTGSDNDQTPAGTRGYPTLASSLTRTRAGGAIYGTHHPYHPSHIPSAGGTWKNWILSDKRDARGTGSSCGGMEWVNLLDGRNSQPSSNGSRN